MNKKLRRLFGLVLMIWSTLALIAYVLVILTKGC